ncbi:MAG: HAD-IA family hydrolase [Cypionkella sp.]
MTDTDLGPYQAVLFDMDGTILTSIAAVERAWTAWALRSNYPVAEVLAHMHGRRARDTMRDFLPDGADIDAEARWLEAVEYADVAGIAEVPGAAQFLRALPPERWAVVTSATRALALRRIAAAGLPLPRVLIAAEDVMEGKPNPAGYLKGAQALGVSIAQVLVVEDAEAGLQAGLAAGAEVLRIAGPTQSADSGLRATILSYAGATVSISQGMIRIRLP